MREWRLNTKGIKMQVTGLVWVQEQMPRDGLTWLCNSGKGILMIDVENYSARAYLPAGLLLGLLLIKNAFINLKRL